MCSFKKTSIYISGCTSLAAEVFLRGAGLVRHYDQTVHCFSYICFHIFVVLILTVFAFDNSLSYVMLLSLLNQNYKIFQFYRLYWEIEVDSRKTNYSGDLLCLYFVLHGEIVR